jgi:hypothetical protein
MELKSFSKFGINFLLFIHEALSASHLFQAIEIRESSNEAE